MNPLTVAVPYVDGPWETKAEPVQLNIDQMPIISDETGTLVVPPASCGQVSPRSVRSVQSDRKIWPNEADANHSAVKGSSSTHVLAQIPSSRFRTSALRPSLPAVRSRTVWETIPLNAFHQSCFSSCEPWRLLDSCRRSKVTSGEMQVRDL